MEKEYFEARFSGTGGQGLMIIGDILANAAGCGEGEEILLLKSYGPESRGGSCRSELIVSDETINYPAVTKPNFLLAMSQLACDSYAPDLTEDGVLVIDSDLVKKVPTGIKNLYALPLTEIAKNEIGKVITANIVALGAIAVLGGFVSESAIHEAILEHFPKKLHEINEKAFFAGMSAAKALV